MNHPYVRVLFLCLLLCIPLDILFGTDFYIVRHGQTDWNVQNRIQGCRNIPLNDAGRAQAAELAQQFHSIRFDCCYSSDVQRVVETALILCGTLSIPMQVDHRLRQRNFGLWEGRLSSEFNALVEQELQTIETDEALQKRVLVFLREIADLHRGSNVLITTHGGLMRNLIAIQLSLPASAINVENMAFLKLQVDDGHMHIIDMQGITLPY